MLIHCILPYETGDYAFDEVCSDTEGAMCVLNIEEVDFIGQYAFDSFGYNARNTSITLNTAHNISNYAFNYAGYSDFSYASVSIYVGKSDYLG